MTKMRIGTRGSALALAQANIVKARLESLGMPAELIIIRTTGDALAEAPLAAIGGKGIFIKEIQEFLLDKRVDLAVHSLKDLPTEVQSGLTIAAVMEREDPRDCLVSRFGEQLRELPRGSVVGTSSLRRQAQVKAAKSGVRLRDLRGNLDTRLRKVHEGEVDAIIVAHAGVKRLGRTDDVSEILEVDVMLPAPGQGFIALETREKDAARDWAAKLGHAPSALAARAERAFLAALGGGCRVPIAAYAREVAGKLVLDGLVISVDGKTKAKGRESAGLDGAEALGEQLATQLLEQGAQEILDALDSPRPVDAP